MSTINQARDALNVSDGDFVNAREEAEAMALDAVGAVVRAADLAAELRSRGERLSESAYVHERAEGAGYVAAAAQLMEALEGEKE